MPQSKINKIRLATHKHENGPFHDRMYSNVLWRHVCVTCATWYHWQPRGCKGKEIPNTCSYQSPCNVHLTTFKQDRNTKTNFCLTKRRVEAHCLTLTIRLFWLQEFFADGVASAGQYGSWQWSQDEGQSQTTQGRNTVKTQIPSHMISNSSSLSPPCQHITDLLISPVSWHREVLNSGARDDDPS